MTSPIFEYLLRFLLSSTIFVATSFSTFALETASDSIMASNAAGESFHWRQLAVPASLIALGTWGVGNGWFGTVNRDTQEMFCDLSNGHRFKADDYIQYVPIATGAALNFTGKGLHPRRERWLMMGTAVALTAIMVNGVKWAVDELRPDGSAYNSFPSGHTATAFVGAELVRMEYGNAWGLGAYTIATTVGILRMYNNRHWLNDVLAGAGIGILSARAALWLLPLERRLLGWNKRPSSPTVALMPMTSPGFYGLSVAASF